MIPDKNVLKAAKSAVWSKGFDVKTWRKFRSPKCKGKGVGKCLDALNSFGLPPSGEIKGLESNMLAPVEGELELLNKRMIDAKKACGVLQKETKEFIEEYQKRIKSLISEIDSRLKKEGVKGDETPGGSKTKGETPDGNEKLGKLAKDLDRVTPGGDDKQIEQDQNDCEDIETKAEKLIKTLTPMNAAIGKAEARVVETGKKWRGAFEREGIDIKLVEDATRKALESFRKQFKIDAFARELDGTISGELIKLENRLKKIKPKGDVKGFHADASDELGRAKAKHIEVANALGAFNKLYTGEVDALNKRSGNVPKEMESETPGGPTPR